MFTWILENRLGKAAAHDPLPAGVAPVGVAAELGHPFPLHDDERADETQRANLERAVHAVLAHLDAGRPVAAVCAVGRSRSVTVACLAAALHLDRSFVSVWLDLKTKDHDLADPSPLLPLARQLYPDLFEEG